MLYKMDINFSRKPSNRDRLQFRHCLLLHPLRSLLTMLGIFIGGPASLDYLRDFNRWLTRIIVEKALGGRVPATDPQDPSTDPPTSG